MRAAASLALALSLLSSAAMAGDLGPRLGPDGAWQVIELDGAEIAPSDNVVVSFNGGRISGNSGCNRFSGSYDLTRGLSFGGLAMTRMACPGRRGTLEASFTAAMDRVNDWRFTDVEGAGTELQLLRDARPVLRALLQP